MFLPIRPTGRLMQQQWILLVVRLSADPSRHRVAVWRRLRQVGALALGQGVWALPATPAFTASLDRTAELARRGGGEVLLLDAVGHDEAHEARLEALFVADREAEWGEFLRDCAKYEAELDNEISIEKFTLAELDEEEHSLDRLRRWYRELRVRDVFGAPSATMAEQRLKQCVERLEGYAERVYDAIHRG
jgi:hypothetical protein